MIRIIACIILSVHKLIFIVISMVAKATIENLGAYASKTKYLESLSQ